MYFDQMCNGLPNKNKKVKNSITNHGEERNDTIEGVLRALLASTAPSSTASTASTSWSGRHSFTESQTSKTTSNHLTSLIDSHNLASVGSNINIAKSFIETKGVKPMNRYRGLSVDEKHGVIMAQCCNPVCSSRLPLTEAMSRYKSCHHCYTYYCCRGCRQQDWDSHKMEACPLARAVSAAKAVIKRILIDESCHNVFSSLGRGGYLRVGRGCIVLWFNNCSEAEYFAEFGLKDLRNHPVYVAIKNIHILISKFAPHSLSSVQEACSSYNPEQSIVINVSVAVEEAVLRSCKTQVRHAQIHAVKKCLTISLSNCFLESLSLQQHSNSLRPTSLLLTMLPGQESKESLDYKDRQVIFVNILRQLEARGVNLSRQYPTLYRDLTQFVENNSSICPTTIYPTDKFTGRAFVCMISPQSDPISSVNPFSNEPMNRSSSSSFMAELEAVIPNWENAEITDL